MYGLEAQRTTQRPRTHRRVYAAEPQVVENAFRKSRNGEVAILDLIATTPSSSCGNGSALRHEVQAGIREGRGSAVPESNSASNPCPSLASSADGTTLQGKHYRNNYVFVLELQEGHITTRSGKLRILPATASKMKQKLWKRAYPALVI